MLPLLGAGPSAGVLPYTDKALGTESANILAYWPMGEAVGSNADNLEGTAARDGTYANVTLGQTGIGDGLTCPLFNGSTSFVDIYSNSLRDAFNYNAGTMMIWVKVNTGVWADGEIRSILILAEAPAGGSFYVRFRKEIVSNNLRYFRSDGSSAVSQTLTYSGTAWFNLLLTWSVSGNQLKCYINGVQVGATQTGLVSDAGPLDSGKCNIGSTTDAPTQLWSGWLAHCMLWDKVISGSSITAVSRL